MADTKFTALPSVSNYLSTNLIPVVEDPTGTPVTKQVSVLNFLANLTMSGIVLKIPNLEVWDTGSSTCITIKNAAGSVVAGTLGRYSDGGVILVANAGSVQINAGSSANDVVITTNNPGGKDIILTPNAGNVRINKPIVALGGGAAPTLGTIGGSGPAAAAQNGWIQIKDSTGALCWVPCWK